MAYPDTYKIDYSYTGFAAGLGDGSFPGTQLDNDLIGFGKANASFLAFLQSAFRSDGKLHNNSVGPDQLSPALKIGFTNRGQWRADARYDAGDGVVYADRFYSARKQHKATDGNRPDVCKHHWLFLFHVSDFAIPGGSIVTEKLADEAITYEKLAASALAPHPTVVGMPGVKVPEDVNAIQVSGYYAAGDGGAARYRKAAIEPSHAGKFQSADGVWWALAEDTVSAEMFGAKPLTEAALLARNGGVAVEIAANDTAFEAAIDFMAQRGGGTINAFGQFYVRSRRTEMVPGVTINGAGVGRWDAIIALLPKTWEGTTFLYCGTGERDIKFFGVTSMKTGGGWREDPDDPAVVHKLFSAYNSDAGDGVPAAQRSFSAAVYFKPRCSSAQLTNVRVCPWIGADGISEYNNMASASLGADWDFGILIHDSSHNIVTDVQSVGYWREGGVATILTKNEGADDRKSGERNRLIRVVGQGRVGRLNRGSDRYPVTAWATSSITIPWSEEFIFPSTGELSTSGAGTVAYSSWRKEGDKAVFALTGSISANPTEIRLSNNGLSGSMDEDCYYYSLCHTSKSNSAGAALFGLSDSRALEMSGFPLRAQNALNTKYHGYERTLAFIHDAYDPDFAMSQFEGSKKLVIATNRKERNPAPYPCGEVRSVTMSGPNNINECDLRLFAPRSGFIPSLQMAIRGTLYPDTRLRPLGDGYDVILEDFSGGLVARFHTDKIYLFQNTTAQPGQDNTTIGGALRKEGNLFLSSEGVPLSLNRAGGGGQINLRVDGVFAGQVSMTTTRLITLAQAGYGWSAFADGQEALNILATDRAVEPGANNAQRLGGPNRVWSDIYATNVRLGNSAVTITAGAGSPEGVVSASVGSMYLQTNGSANSSLWIKEGGGSGSTGWAAK